MNLYVHFPFCRRKCSYCALHSRPVSTSAERAEYVRALNAQLSALNSQLSTSNPQLSTSDSQLSTSNLGLSTFDFRLSTIYFGGGSPALCDLAPLFDALAPHMDGETEFTVELHPLDVASQLLKQLKSGGVNRISMGVQSLDDGILKAMGRGYSFAEAERAFALVREHFENAGIDLIAGYPGESAALTPRHARLAKWGLAHCSVYSLILEDKTALAALERRGKVALPDDDTMLNRISVISRFLGDIGLERYEISNYAVPGRECRHNLATWRGEDYIGLGEGAMGRIGLVRTADGRPVETVTPEFDLKERTIFRLRTREGLDASRFPQWRGILDDFTSKGLLSGAFPLYRLTERGTEVCDSILAEL